MSSNDSISEAHIQKKHPSILSDTSQTLYLVTAEEMQHLHPFTLRLAETFQIRNFGFGGNCGLFFLLFQIKFIVLEGQSLSYTSRLPVKKKGKQVHNKHQSSLTNLQEPHKSSLPITQWWQLERPSHPSSLQMCSPLLSWGHTGGAKCIKQGWGCYETCKNGRGVGGCTHSAEV